MGGSDCGSVAVGVCDTGMGVGVNVGSGVEVFNGKGTGVFVGSATEINGVGETNSA